jgi:hypothetical protein
MPNVQRKPYRGLAAEKIPKGQVHYRRGFEDNKFCARCSMFIEPASCSAVAGTIGRTDICDLYQRRKSAA